MFFFTVLLLLFVRFVCHFRFNFVNALCSFILYLVIVLFFPVFSRAFLIFFTHFVHCNIALFVVAGFLCNNNSRCAQCFALSVRFFVVLWLEGI